LLALLGLTYSGCSIFRPAGKTPETLSATTDEEVRDAPVAEHVDTVEWTIIPESEIAPIRSRKTELISKFKDTYNLVLLAPFNAQAFGNPGTGLSNRSSQLIHFYAGMQFGLTYHTPDLDLKLTVLDTEDPMLKNELESIPALREADILIGPYFSQDLERFSDFVKSKQKVLISPWNSSTPASENQFFIQMRPSLRVHCEKILAFALGRFHIDEIKLVGKNQITDRGVLDLFQSTRRKISTSDTLENIPELIIDNISNPDVFEHLRLLIQEQNAKAFIVPNWQDPSFILSFLSKLNFAKSDSLLEVYGLPQWIDMERMDYNYYENLNVHVSNSSPLNYDGPLAEQFREHFFSTYSILPEADAYFGFDLIRLIYFLLKHEGTLIINGLDREFPGDLFNQFEFVARLGPNSEVIDFYENVFVRMYRFDQYRFYRID
jgi:hypothetical protein